MTNLDRCALRMALHRFELVEEAMKEGQPSVEMKLNLKAGIDYLKEINLSQEVHILKEYEKFLSDEWTK